SRFRSSSYAAHIAHSFPTRRSSDLEALCPQRARREGLAQLLRRGEHRFRPAAVDERSGFGRRQGALEVEQAVLVLRTDLDLVPVDRKSTRLNSSHVKISYAVFCLKK